MNYPHSSSISSIKHCWIFPLYFPRTFLILQFSVLRRPYKCPSCQNRYKHKCSLDKHIKWICGKEPQFQCNLCPRTFKQKYHCKSHMKIVHKLSNAQVSQLGVCRSFFFNKKSKLFWGDELSFTLLFHLFNKALCTCPVLSFTFSVDISNSSIFSAETPLQVSVL
jgi:hypothetical protein